jgi:hypothetical protein
LRTEQLNDKDIQPILEETETGECPEWKDITNCSPTYKSYWAQWKSFTMRKNILKRHWEFSNRQYEIVQTGLPRTRVNSMVDRLEVIWV